MKLHVQSSGQGYVTTQNQRLHSVAYPPSAKLCYASKYKRLNSSEMDCTQFDVCTCIVTKIDTSDGTLCSTEQ